MISTLTLLGDGKKLSLTVIPIIVGSLETIVEGLLKEQEDLEIIG